MGAGVNRVYDNGITTRSDVPIQFYVFNLVCLCSVVVSFFSSYSTFLFIK